MKAKRAAAGWMKVMLDRAFPVGPVPGFSPEPGRPDLLPRLIVLAVLVASAGLDDGARHAHSHWLLLVGYAFATGLAAFGRVPGLAGGGWAPTFLDAGLASYVLLEHLLIVDRGHPAGADTVSQLPAFLLLLASGLALRLDRTAAFAAVVAACGGAAIVIGYAGRGLDGSAAGHQAFALAAFVAASAFVLHGIARLRHALGAALAAERERSFLSRFVPPGTDLERFDGHGRSEVLRRHACLLAVDIRGFSELSRRHRGPDVLRWLLQVRAAINEAVTAEGGTVDKYVGDGVLAQFFEGEPRNQACAALAAVLAIRERLENMNRARVDVDLPEIRLVTALHAGTVLAGILDDGMRAELTVLGPAMNALSRIERRAKEDDLDMLASKRFVGLLGTTLPGRLSLRRLDRRAWERDVPDLVALISARVDGRLDHGRQDGACAA